VNQAVLHKRSQRDLESANVAQAVEQHGAQHRRGPQGLAFGHVVEQKPDRATSSSSDNGSQGPSFPAPENRSVERIDPPRVA
jgi:hypothetical protein